MSNDLKVQLYNFCLDFANTRISNAHKAMSDAQNSANSETKSTAGDKHDTARAMMQLEVEQQAKQFSEANKFKQALAQFTPESGKDTVALGSLVLTNTANYYLSISVGKIEIKEDLYFAISPLSPIGKELLGLKQGDSFQFNGQNIKIDMIL